MSQISIATEYTADQARKIVGGLVAGRPRRPMSDNEWLYRTDPGRWEEERKFNQGEAILRTLETLVDVLQAGLKEQTQNPRGGGGDAQRARTTNPRGSIFTNVARRTNPDSG